MDLSDDDTLIAGQLSVLGFSIQGISSRKLERLASSLSASQANAAVGAYAVLDTQTMARDFLASIAWNYFASIESSGGVAAGVAGMIESPGMSYGLVHMAAHPNKLFGIVTASLSFDGFMMDIGHLRRTRVDLSNDQGRSAIFGIQRGQHASGQEHEQLERVLRTAAFCNVNNLPASGLPPCNGGVSALKAIAFAEAAGQKIFRINRSNIASIDALAHSDSTLEDIRNAAMAGLDVVVHERPVSLEGWTGTGYAVLDPNTGAGGYLIEGGANGGSFYSDVGKLLSALLGLLIPSAHASGGHNAEVSAIEALAKVLEHMGSGLASALGAVISGLIAFIHALKIVSSCQKHPALAVIGVGSILAMINMGGAAAAFFLPLAGFFAAFMFLFIAFLTALLVAAWTDFYAAKCEATP